MKYYIKNMVCDRCKLVVKTEIEKLGFTLLAVSLGEIELKEQLDELQKQQLIDALEALGFSLIDDKKSRIIEQIKTIIIEMVHHSSSELKINLSDYLSDRLHLEYNYISNLFSEIEGVTIEKYYIAQKIEKVKELLIYDELTLSEIAFMLNYSSVAHLSAQFKKITGLTPSYFKNLKIERRKPLDKV
ncbi:MAG: helix-turn-helix domain-containing protein [Dysgonomonas sp.]